MNDTEAPDGAEPLDPKLLSSPAVAVVPGLPGAGGAGTAMGAGDAFGAGFGLARRLGTRTVVVTGGSVVVVGLGGRGRGRVVVVG